MLSFGAEYFVLSLLYKNIKIKIYRSVLLLVVLYGCENWSITLTLRSLTLYIYGAPILDVSRSHTTTQHSR